MHAEPAGSHDGLLDRTERRRAIESAERDVVQRGALGQFFTPAPVASLLADTFEPPSGAIRVLDPGAGVGSLTAAVVARAAAEGWDATLDIHAIELDESLVPALNETLHDCARVLPSTRTYLHSVDFIQWATEQLGGGLFTSEPERFDLAVLNPPYRKLNTASRQRRLLSGVGIEATNLYAAFVSLALRLLKPGGQLVAITPRSFCNGPYFKAFRHELLTTSALRRIHVFEARDRAFRDTHVLQENVITHLVKGAVQGDVVIASSTGHGGDQTCERVVPFPSVVHPGDGNSFIHVVPNEEEGEVPVRMRSLACELARLGASVSTGRVVDFRARDHLRNEPAPDTVPLLYPVHLRGGRVTWPAPSGKKPNALAVNDETRKLLLPAGNYVLVKRFSSKEERRRVVAAVLQAGDFDTEQMAIENHINVFHRENAGLPLDLAWGIAAFLNSTIVDLFFRQFNGHTQVNATDLRSLRYPSVNELLTLGKEAQRAGHDQSTIDALVDRIVPEPAAA